MGARLCIKRPAVVARPFAPVPGCSFALGYNTSWESAQCIEPLQYFLPRSAAQAVAIGIIWLSFTLCFEFLFGRYIVGHSWGRLFQDYDLLSGRVWLLLLAWLTCLPYIAYKFHEPGDCNQEGRTLSCNRIDISS